MDLHKAMLLKAQEERDGLHFQLQVGGVVDNIICNLNHVITFCVILEVFILQGISMSALKQ